MNSTLNTNTVEACEAKNLTSNNFEVKKVAPFEVKNVAPSESKKVTSYEVKNVAPSESKIAATYEVKNVTTPQIGVKNVATPTQIGVKNVSAPQIEAKKLPTFDVNKPERVQPTIAAPSTITTTEVKKVASISPKFTKKSDENTTQKSSLRNSLREYRRPTKSKNPPNSAASEFARALSGSEVSVTAVVGPKQPPAPVKQQPPIVSMFPVPVSSSVTSSNSGRVLPVQGTEMNY